VNSSANERFQDAFARVWLHLRRGDEPDLSEHERQLLHHIPARAPGVTLGEVADHLALPRSSASVLVKDLARRGFVRRARDRRDERRNQPRKHDHQDRAADAARQEGKP
jgi:DNA-binding MarR family transcriptional regulator